MELSSTGLAQQRERFTQLEEAVEAVPGSIYLLQAVGTQQGPSQHSYIPQHSGAVLLFKQTNSKGDQGSVHIDKGSSRCCFDEQGAVSIFAIPANICQ